MSISKTSVDFYSKLNNLSIIKHDIRNYRKLNEKQLLYIQTSTTENEKIEIIELFNKCLYIVCKILIKDEIDEINKNKIN
jgi:hypothetical protein